MRSFPGELGLSGLQPVSPGSGWSPDGSLPQVVLGVREDAGQYWRWDGRPPSPNPLLVPRLLST